MKLCKDQTVCLNNIPDQKTHRAGNTIDFLICDNIADSIIVECTVDEHAPNISHHFPVIYKIQAVFNCRSTHVQRPRRSYRNFELSDFKDDLQNKLAGLSSCDSFESKVKTFQSHLKACYDDHIPLKSSSIIYNQRPSWLDHEYVLQRALRRKLKRVFDRTGSTQDEINYKIQRTKCALLVGEKVDSKISKIFGESNGNTKALFNMYGKLVNNTVSKCSQANLPEPDEHGGCLGLANKFNSFFMDKVKKTNEHINRELRSIACTNNDTILNQDVFSNGTSYLTNFRPCDLGELKEIIMDSPIKTTYGIDPLPKQLMSNCLDILLPHLLDLVNTSLVTGSIDGVKFSHV